MKKNAILIASLIILALSLAACGWNPSVTAVPLTAPWEQMNLPIKENAVVWGCTPTEFKAAHKDDKKTILGKYTDALKAQGWTLDKFEDNSKSGNYDMDMSKGADKIHVEVYDFQNTGVIIKKI